MKGREKVLEMSKKGAEGLKKQGKFRIAIFVMIFIVGCIIAVNVIQRVVYEKEYQSFVKNEIYTDDHGVNILGTYVPVGKDVTHIIQKETSEHTKLDYILFVVKDNKKAAVMRISEKHADFLSRYLSKSTEIDLDKLNG